MAFKLRVQNFRCHQDKTIEIPTGVAIITGDNGSGKTSLLEAAYIAFRGSSWRSNNSEILRHIGETTSQWWRIDLADEALTEDRTVKFQQLEDKSKTEFTINGRVTTRLAPRAKRPVIFFEPGDMALLYGSPERRRRFLDRFIAQNQVGYASLLSRFERVARQRSRLIREDDYTSDEKMIWDLQFSGLSYQVSQARRGLVQELNQTLNERYSEIAGAKVDAQMRFLPGAPDDADEIMYRLTNQVGMVTPVGANRDDFKFIFRGKDAKTSASRGENRSLLFAALAAVTDLTRRQYGDRVVVLLDDIDSELDAAHRRNLYNVSSFRQNTIATTLEYSGVGTNIKLS